MTDVAVFAIAYLLEWLIVFPGVIFVLYIFDGSLGRQATNEELIELGIRP
jgi:hypothetical protein